MPRREDLSTVLVIGSGPIVIGQACEFDYSGTQACKALRREGYRVVLVNSNPATIMTDPELADRTYVEPLTPDSVLAVIRRERPDALLPTLGGQTGLNLAVELAEAGHLEVEGVRLIGADLDAIHRAENRRLFVETMRAAGLPMPRSGLAHSVDEAAGVAAGLGYPVMVRPSFALGGGGTGIARSEGHLREVAAAGIGESPIGEILVEESVEGWKEFELEVMRDAADQGVVVCSIENLDPVGVHTGDSITVAPTQTLSDREYQAMRDAALACIRAVGVETGGSNIQFAVEPGTGRTVVIEMNPRVSRSSALASKATGFPIAKIAALLAVGYRLDELRNDITGATPACFEPALDYVVVKIPRWSFEKFPEADPRLSTSMRSVGEVMGIGRTFAEALGKARRSLERAGVEPCPPPQDLLGALSEPTEGRLALVEAALAGGHTVDEVASASGIDPWFVDRIAAVVETEGWLGGRRLARASREELLDAKRAGLSDARLGGLLSATEREVRAARRAAGVRPVFKTVDTCAGEFEARTPYHYSTYEAETEVRPADRPRVVILGSGPNRIGQGIEFDYACVHAALTLDEAGFDPVMVNCNPETVSTDYDLGARLYFEPLTAEDVLEVCEAEDPIGVIVQLGGQTPLKLAAELEAEGHRVLGTAPSAIDLAEDRGKFGALLRERGILQPPHAEAASTEEALEAARRIGYPVVVRPSYVLGGRGMEIVDADDDLRRYVEAGVAAGPDHPVLIDRFLEGAIEVDVDAVADGEDVVVVALMEHIEEAGIHSGDSSCVLPPVTIPDEHVEEIERITGDIARALDVRGLLNVQLALRDDRVWVLEANPRASRTVPFVSKATGYPIAKAATRVLVGQRVAELRAQGLLPPDSVVERRPRHVAVKAAVLPFRRFPGLDTVLGPEMRSTGEVMGIDEELGAALAKAQAATGAALPSKGTVFVSLANRDKRAAVFPIKRLADLGFEVVATRGTARLLARAGVAVSRAAKVSEAGPSAVDLLASGAVDLVVNTPFGRGTRGDGYHIRTAAAREGIPCITTLQGLFAAVQGIEAQVRGLSAPRSLQEYHPHLDRGVGSEP